ncbi:hypothetical protein TCON_1861 [Astathelohania contejeani]|uniref:Uncharacterized protein n=1 Tax=Astathelohania contejeani TaxID=164912 RepID=A0ABQ7HXM5_9MICR|nr:hypothetical protein TCON_1861 [Thelohania contejeani]
MNSSEIGLIWNLINRSNRIRCFNNLSCLLPMITFKMRLHTEKIKLIIIIILYLKKIYCLGFMGEPQVINITGNRNKDEYKNAVDPSKCDCRFYDPKCEAFCHPTVPEFNTNKNIGVDIRKNNSSKYETIQKPVIYKPPIVKNTINTTAPIITITQAPITSNILPLLLKKRIEDAKVSNVAMAQSQIDEICNLVNWLNTYESKNDNSSNKIIASVKSKIFETYQLKTLNCPVITQNIPQPNYYSQLYYKTTITPYDVVTRSHRKKRLKEIPIEDTDSNTLTNEFIEDNDISSSNENRKPYKNKRNRYNHYNILTRTISYPPSTITSYITSTVKFIDKTPVFSTKGRFRLNSSNFNNNKDKRKNILTDDDSNFDVSEIAENPIDAIETKKTSASYSEKPFFNIIPTEDTLNNSLSPKKTSETEISLPTTTLYKTITLINSTKTLPIIERKTITTTIFESTTSIEPTIHANTSVSSQFSNKSTSTHTNIITIKTVTVTESLKLSTRHASKESFDIKITTKTPSTSSHTPATKSMDITSIDVHTSEVTVTATTTLSPELMISTKTINVIKTKFTTYGKISSIDKNLDLTKNLKTTTDTHKSFITASASINEYFESTSVKPVLSTKTKSVSINDLIADNVLIEEIKDLKLLLKKYKDNTTDTRSTSNSISPIIISTTEYKTITDTLTIITTITANSSYKPPYSINERPTEIENIINANSIDNEQSPDIINKNDDELHPSKTTNLVNTVSADYKNSIIAKNYSFSLKEAQMREKLLEERLLKQEKIINDYSLKLKKKINEFDNIRKKIETLETIKPSTIKDYYTKVDTITEKITTTKIKLLTPDEKIKYVTTTSSIITTRISTLSPEISSITKEKIKYITTTNNLTTTKTIPITPKISNTIKTKVKYITVTKNLTTTRTALLTPKSISRTDEKIKYITVTKNLITTKTSTIISEKTTESKFGANASTTNSNISSIITKKNPISILSSSSVVNLISTFNEKENRFSIIGEEQRKLDDDTEINKPDIEEKTISDRDDLTSQISHIKSKINYTTSSLLSNVANTSLTSVNPTEISTKIRNKNTENNDIICDNKLKKILYKNILSSQKPNIILQIKQPRNCNSKSKTEDKKEKDDELIKENEASLEIEGTANIRNIKNSK